MVICFFTSTKELFTMVIKLLAYIFYLPALIFICPIYAYSRLNDFSWGTKGLTNETFTDQTIIY